MGAVIQEVERMERKTAWFGVLCIAMALVLGIAAFGFAQNLVATEFRSNGDLISDWYWLRDQALQQYAEWTFEGIPAGAEDLTLEITALATDRASGGRWIPTEFCLIYGFPGSGKIGGVFETKMVTLPNVSPPNDPLGYTCRGVVTISRSAFPAASTLVFRVERTSPDANHVAFNRESIIILVPPEETHVLELETVRPSDFVSIGNSILETVWCRRPGHALEWIWGPLNEERGAIVEAVVNFNLLVTNTFDGGSGFSASVPITIFNLDNEVVELGILELTNTFRPKFSGDTGGVGYATSGTYELKDSDLILNGFRLRLTWPAIAPLETEAEPTGTPRHFGGNRESALLAYIVGPSAQGTQGLLQVSLYDIISDPQAYEGRTVRLEGEFYGWVGELVDCPPPVTRSDWILGADGWYLYVTGALPEGLSPSSTQDYGKAIMVVGAVRIKLESPIQICPYIEVQSVEVIEEKE